MGATPGAPAVDHLARRIICPYVRGMLAPETQLALRDYGLPVDFVRLPTGDDTAYGRMVRNLWRGGETFVICEQDIVPTAAQLFDIATCGHLWCSYSYDDGLYPDGPMFGLVRLDRQLMELWPDAADAALIQRDKPRWMGKVCEDEKAKRLQGEPWAENGERRWWAVDNAVARDLDIRRVPWHQHEPPVRHVHSGPPSGPP